LVHNNGLVKTKQFKEPKYVGDPINAVKIFNEKEVDELIVIDIDASIRKKEPDYRLIENLAVECRMPFCYGGGIKTIEQAKRIFSLGVEKIAVSSAAVENPRFITEMADKVGNQSVVVVIDTKKKTINGTYELYTYNGTKANGIDPFSFVVEMQKAGVGEIVINSIDHDGMMDGFDLDLLFKIRHLVTVPLTVMGGAGKLDDLGAAIAQHGIIGVAAGSLFVFKGKFKAVLINYPTRKEKECFFFKNNFLKENSIDNLDRQ